RLVGGGGQVLGREPRGREVLCAHARASCRGSTVEASASSSADQDSGGSTGTRTNFEKPCSTKRSRMRRTASRPTGTIWPGSTSGRGAPQEGSNQSGGAFR